MAFPVRFIRQAAVMMAGTTLAQAIPLFVAPLLTRLYSPEQFGVLSAVVAASAIATVIATLRYELAILLPGDEAGAINVAAVAGLCTIAVSVMLLLLGLLDSRFVAVWWGQSGALWEVVALLTLSIAATQILNFIATRAQRFRWIASSLIVQQAAAALVAIGIGLFLVGHNGLVLGRVAGQLCAVAILLVAVLPWIRRGLRSVELQFVRRVALKYRQFPQFNVPYSLLGTFSREFLILVFTALGHAGVAGQYGLARAVLSAPISFLSSSLSQVFYREAASSLGTPAFRRLTMTMLVGIAAGLTPLFVFGWLWAPAAFEMIFGAQWRDAGDYAAILMPIVFLALFTSWPERVFEVSGKQRCSLIIQVCFDSFSILAVVLTLRVGLPVQVAIRIYVAIQVFYHLAYLAAIFYLSLLGWKLYFGFVVLLMALVLLSAVIQVALMQFVTLSFFYLIVAAGSAMMLGVAMFLSANAAVNRLQSLDVDAAGQK